MDSFFTSKFIQDLGRGELPEVRVSLTKEGLFNLSLALFFVIGSAILLNQIVKKAAN